jgi:superfamily I DNA and/or RNA helicase
MIIDEAGIERLQDLLAPFCYGVNQLAPETIRNSSDNFRVNNLTDLISQCGIVATVVGDPKQSRPIGLTNRDASAIEYVIKRAPSDTLRITHRLPDRLSGLVDDFAKYNGLKSAPEIAMRRLTLDHSPDVPYRDIIEPEEVITWVDIDGIEEEILASSWINDLEAKACAKVCNHLRSLTNKSIVVITRFTGQKMQIRNYMRMMGVSNIRITTTTGALGTQSDIVIFSLVRNNPNRIVGAAGTLQDLNVAISRAKEKLIIMGNFDMALNGWSGYSQYNTYWRRSPSRNLARLIDSRYGKIVGAPPVLRCT